MNTSTANPFPGMNPFMELHWGDVHTALLTYICDVLSDELPSDLSVRSEERIEMMEQSAQQVRVFDYRADVSISERWKMGLPPVWQGPGAMQALNVMEPEFALVTVDPEVERWVEIRDSAGGTISVIEVLSPSNKGSKRHEYRARRQRFVDTGINVIEIDLLRVGRTVTQATSLMGKPYTVTVYRSGIFDRCEIYRSGLRDRLPCFRLPLRKTDPDLPLDLQPLIDRVYSKRRYWQLDYSRQLEPQLQPDDLEWAHERLRGAGIPC